MPRKSHTHKYILRPTGSSPVWACALDFCNHYMPSHLTSLVEGRMSECWNCETPFKLDSDAMKAEDGKPFCPVCRITTGQAVMADIISSKPTINTIPSAQSNNSISQMCRQCGNWKVKDENSNGLCMMCITDNIKIGGKK